MRGQCVSLEYLMKNPKAKVCVAKAGCRRFHLKSVFTLAAKLSLALVVLFPQAGAGQTLAITNGIQTYGALTNTTVTMTGRAELRVTATNNPIPGCLINLNSSDAWFFLPAIRPSVVASTYLGQIRVNGATAVAGSNCRLDQ